MMEKLPVFILTGPTGSGKSARALALAAARNGIIINADAMQTYKDLRILSARPTEEETAGAPHALYGVMDVFDACTAARWVAMAAEEIRNAWAAGRLPMLVGGTGMYLTSLMRGLAHVPDIPASIRAQVRALQEPYSYLQSIDPVMASRLKPGDSQRVARAIEVMESTGTSLAEWQGRSRVPPLPEAAFTMELTELPREELYARIDRRLDSMMEQGALDEARQLWEKVRQRFPGSRPHLDLSATYPLLRAHGVPEFFAYFESRMTLQEAIGKAKQNTRNYAKRQMTWIRNQFSPANH